MLLKEILALRPKHQLDIGLITYGINNKDLKKKEIIDILNDKILDDDMFLVNILRLTYKEKQLIKNSQNKIKVNDNNLASIVNIDSFLFGYLDNDYYLIADDIRDKYLSIISSITNADIIIEVIEVIVYCVNFYGIFTLDDLYKLYRLKKNNNLPKETFGLYVNQINSTFNYFSIDNGLLISNDLKEYPDFKHQYVIPKLKDIEEYYVKHYIENKQIYDLKKWILNKNNNQFETELIIRMLYQTMLLDDNDEAIKIISHYFSGFNDQDVEEISKLYVEANYYTPKLSLKGKRKID